MKKYNVIALLALLLLIATSCIPASFTSEETMEDQGEKNEFVNQSINEVNDLNIQIKELKREKMILIDKLKQVTEANEGFQRVLTDKDMFIDRLIKDQGGGNNQVLFDFYRSHFLPSRESDEAKALIETRSQEALKYISTKDMDSLAKLAHPTQGIRFTPFTTVDIKHDLVYTAEEIPSFFYDANDYLWGIYSDSYDEIRFTRADYFERFIYDVDYTTADKIGYNEVLGTSTHVENQYAIYHDAISVEYYKDSTDSNDSTDWRSLRLLFQEHESQWYIVGIIHNEWVKH